MRNFLQPGNDHVNEIDNAVVGITLTNNSNTSHYRERSSLTKREELRKENKCWCDGNVLFHDMGSFPRWLANKLKKINCNCTNWIHLKYFSIWTRIFCLIYWHFICDFISHPDHKGQWCNTVCYGNHVTMIFWRVQCLLGHCKDLSTARTL